MARIIDIAGDGCWSFLSFESRERAVTLRLDGQRYGHVVLGVADPEELRSRLRQAAGNGVSEVPELAGDRIALRPLRAQDVPHLVEIGREPEVARWWGPARRGAPHRPRRRASSRLG
jgi:hypothetical protein